MGAIALSGRLPASAQTLAEALDTTNLAWTTGGSSSWFYQTTNTHDGVDAVQSGPIGTNETSWIETTVVGPATISYWERRATGHYGPINQLSIEGSINSPFVQQVVEIGQWGQHTFDLGAGTNVLRWTVHNHLGGSVGYYGMDEFVVLPPRPLAFTWQPADQTVGAGEWVVMAADATGTPPLFYQWQHNGTNIVDGTNDWIWFDAVTTNDGGVYSATVSNSQGAISTTNAVLTILTSPPFFISEPASVTAYSGQTLTLGAALGGSGPLSTQWRKDGTNLGPVDVFSSSHIYGAGSLTLTNLTFADAGNYSVLLSNNLGSIESSNATLTVLQSVLPVITRQPRSLEVAAGVNTWLSSDGFGTPDPYFYWTRVRDVPPPPPDGPPLPPTEPPIVFGTPYPNRYFYNVSPTNAGVYSVALSNYAGAVTSRDALLTVLPPITNLGAWTEGANDIFVTNGRAYLTQDTNGLAILDMSNPASPQLLGRYDTPGHARGVQVSGGLAFVADGEAGVQIISVTNPASPILVGHYNTPGSAQDVAVRGNQVFVADGSSGLWILNITNPATPSMTGSFSTNFFPAHVCLSDNLALLSSLTPAVGPIQTNPPVGGLLLVDISDPAHPFEAGRKVASIKALAARAPLVFAVDGNLRIISASNTAQPSVISDVSYYPSFAPSPTSFFPSQLQAADVFVANHLVYVVGNFTNLTSCYAFDVRDPGDPIPVGFFALPGEGHALWVDGQRIYLAGYNTPLTILEAPFDPQPESPPSLALSKQGGLKLNIHGRRGLHYTIESATSLTGLPWQPLQTLLLTNDNAELDVPAPTSTKFFRAKRLD
jgi:hypothetical protein